MSPIFNQLITHPGFLALPCRPSCLTAARNSVVEFHERVMTVLNGGGLVLIEEPRPGYWKTWEKV